MILVRLNDEEAHQLDARRRAMGLSRSAYMRMILLEHLKRDAGQKPEQGDDTKTND